MDSFQPPKGHITSARFEFRSFGQHFEAASKRMARLSVPLPEHQWETTSDEMYIISRKHYDNIKIRDNKLVIKRMVQVRTSLEQWNPVMEADFPLNRERLQKEIWPALEMTDMILEEEHLNIDIFLALLRKQDHLTLAHVQKRRSAYQVNNTLCESGIVLINGARVNTICTESIIPADVLKTMKEIGLEGTENINYVQMIKRVCGIIDKPLAN